MLIWQVDYCASKFACVGLDEALRVELAVQVKNHGQLLGWEGRPKNWFPFNQGNSKFIKTTAVCPYYISTGMFSGVSSKIIPILDPEFVASSVVDATLSNKEIILLPWWSTYLFMLKVRIWLFVSNVSNYFKSIFLSSIFSHPKQWWSSHPPSGQTAQWTRYT